ncbi:MAG: hypothetical protein ACPL1H_06470 [bacterium]
MKKRYDLRRLSKIFIKGICLKPGKETTNKTFLSPYDINIL